MRHTHGKTNFSIGFFVLKIPIIIWVATDYNNIILNETISL